MACGLAFQRRRLGRRARSFALAGAVVAAMSSSARAQIASLDKGHQLLVTSGLQMWGLNTDSFNYNFDYNNLTGANLNAASAIARSGPSRLARMSDQRPAAIRPPTASACMTASTAAAPPADIPRRSCR